LDLGLDLNYFPFSKTNPNPFRHTYQRWPWIRSDWVDSGRILRISELYKWITITLLWWLSQWLTTYGHHLFLL